MKFTRPLAIALVVTLLGVSVVGCTQSAEETSSDDPVELAPVVIGTLPTEDALPLWVAEEEGLFEAVGIRSVTSTASPLPGETGPAEVESP